IEDFATPPFVDRAPSPDLPEMVAPDPIVPDLPDDSGASFDTAPDPTVPEQELARLDEAEPVEEFEAGFDTWAEEANAVLDATLPPTDLAPPPPPIEDDFLAEHYYISDLPGPQPPFDDSVLWNDGGDEARDSDIFEDIASDMDLEVDPQVDTMDAEAAFEAAAVPLEEDTSDYISRARAAAKAAAEPASTNRQPRAGRVPSAAKGNGKVPAIAAVSTLAVVIAGTAGFLHLRGKQAAPVLTLNKTPDTTAQPDATLSTPTDTAPTENSLAAVANRIEGDTITGIAPPLAGDQVPSIGEEAPLNAGSPAQLDEQSLAGEEDLPTLDGAAPDKEARLDTNAPVRLATLGQPRIPARITLEDAAAVGDPIAKYDLALKRFQDGQPGLAADLVQQAADAGLVIAQYKLAKLHEQGLGVPRSLEAARDWTTQAASGGNVKAMHDLAVYMTNGEGGEQSYALAAEWYRKAAEFGVVDSQYNLGVFYQDGLGISPSLSEALFWFEVAARQGDQDAAANVSDLRERVSLEAAQQAQRRAQTWRAARADGIANGVLGAQPWNTQTREQVLAIQETLNGLGYDAGTADGLMGAKTRQAILAFQRSAKLDDTGTVTNALIDALNTAAIDARRAG
ncbi:MAG: SEL1-like repeat protein, partial [Pseudomonadota bacterium]